MTTTTASSAAASKAPVTPSKAETYHSVQSQTKERPVNYDSREGTAKWRADASTALVAKRGPAFDAFDPLTGTRRNLGRLDGFLTGPSASSASKVALDYVRKHLSVLGLTSPDLSTLRLRTDYVDPDGIHHLA